jgi:hypothetical protein
VEADALGFNQAAVVVVLMALIAVDRIAIAPGSSHLTQKQAIYSSIGNQSQIENEIRNGDINKLSEHPLFVETYHKETDPTQSTDKRLYQTRDILARKVGEGVLTEALVKEVLFTLHPRNFQPRKQEKQTTQKQQGTLSIQEEIDKNLVLSYWQKNNPDIFEKCIEIDNMLKSDPTTANLTLSERFKKVAAAATQIYGNPIESSSDEDVVSKQNQSRYQEAFSLSLNLAKQGDAKAQFDLGTIYYKGQGVEQNDSQAIYWFRKAALQGYPGAQTSLAAMYQSPKQKTN